MQGKRSDCIEAGVRRGVRTFADALPVANVLTERCPSPPSKQGSTRFTGLTTGSANKRFNSIQYTTSKTINLHFNKLRSFSVLICAVTAIAGCQDEGDESDTRAIARPQQGTLSSALVTPVHVRVQPASLADIHRQATVAGVVEPFRTATVAAETDGRVTLRSVEPGDAVEAGQVLVTLDREKALIDRNRASARVDARMTDLEQASNELHRGQDLHAREFVSEDALERLTFAQARAQSALAAARAELAGAQRVVKDTQVRAPFAGIAEQIHVHQGDYLKSGAPVATLADFSRVRIKAGVTAREAALLHGAERAEVTFDLLGAAPLSGRIHSVGRMSEAASGTYALEIWLEELTQDMRRRMREGMLVTVHLPQADSVATLTVPSVAVFRRGGAMHVFRVEDNRALLTAVRTGRTNGPSIEVLDGLTAGERVVTDGQFALRDGAPVTVTD